MPDRMLVKVGYHRDESLHDFDEAKQVRLTFLHLAGLMIASQSLPKDGALRRIHCGI